jgi:surface antigen
MLRALTVASLLLMPLPGLAPMASAADYQAPEKQKCDDGTKKKRKALGGLFGSVAGNMLGRGMGGTVGSFLPTGELLSEALIAILDCKEQQQAAQATNEAVRGGVGTTTNWTSESRPNVSGSSSVTGQETLADGRQCMTVSDVVIVDGEETTAPKTMCRKPGESKYVRV